MPKISQFKGIQDYQTKVIVNAVKGQSNKVSQIPSTAGIADPATRRVLDSIVSAWRTRNGEAEDAQDARFITSGEIQSAVEGALVSALSTALRAPGSASAGIPTSRQISNLIDDLAAEMRKSLIYQLLETPLSPIQIQQLQQRIDIAIGDARSLIMSEIRVLEEADQVAIEAIDALAVRMGNAEAAIVEEGEVRVDKDNALAKAINTMWANIGGGSAVIEDGQLASVGPGSAVATKWNQVVASVTDPNTGEVNAASIKEELNTYASNVDGSLNSIYSVRAQVSVGGQTVVGGFGLSATAGAGSAQGPTIDFGVRADRFFIAATADTPDAATQIGHGSHIPFMVLTSPQTVNGVVYPAGVYIKKAVIGDATIGTAQIADASIVNAKIANAQITTAKIADAQITTAKIADAQITTAKIAVANVDTLRLAGQAVTIPSSAYVGAAITPAASGDTTLVSVSFVSTGAPVFVLFSSSTTKVYVGEGGGPGAAFIRIFRNGVLLLDRPINYDVGAMALSLTDSPGAGSVTYTASIYVLSTTTETIINSAQNSILALEVKR